MPNKLDYSQLLSRSVLLTSVVLDPGQENVGQSISTDKKKRVLLLISTSPWQGDSTGLIGDYCRDIIVSNIN